ncbi:hypothetical protein ABH17_027835 (plasmid) [Bacillus toyonensis]|uniref:hypothetical protein n=1 Tax=Bacillus cereus group TaxID=86661 RepID=UPI0006AA4564|nr:MULTISPECIES: hypothetical protein [Bacillus cereus group]OKO50781.1 hypothetical protein ABH17_027835 [Bacillus toyonensis]
MNKKYVSIGLLAAIVVMFFWNNKSDYYGEYSTDGQPRYSIKIMDNNQAKLNISNQIYTVNYKEKNKRLEVIQDDVYRIYNEGITEVYFEPQKDDMLLYSVVQNGEKTTIGTYKKIEGSTGKSDEPSVLWLTIKNIFYGFIIFGVMMTIIWFIFSYIQNKNNNSRY